MQFEGKRIEAQQIEAKRIDIKCTEAKRIDAKRTEGKYNEVKIIEEARFVKLARVGKSTFQFVTKVGSKMNVTIVHQSVKHGRCYQERI